MMLKMFINNTDGDVQRYLAMLHDEEVCARGVVQWKQIRAAEDAAAGDEHALQEHCWQR